MLKGPVRARRGARLRAPTALVALSREAEEALFEVAEVLSEGGSSSAERYFGSTMITFHLDRLAASWRGELDGAARARLAHTIEGSVRVHLRAIRLARAEALRRVPERALGSATVETRVRLEGERLLLDVDFEAPLVATRRARR